MTEPTSGDTEDTPQPDPSYSVGYGRPPVHTRFQPGQSGNRRGRPKGARNLVTELAAVLAETVLVREGERSRKVSKLRALIAGVVNRGLKGDHRAVATVLAALLRIEGAAIPADEPADLAVADARILERALGRARACAASRADSGEDDQ